MSSVLVMAHGAVVTRVGKVLMAQMDHCHQRKLLRLWSRFQVIPVSANVCGIFDLKESFDGGRNVSAKIVCVFFSEINLFLFLMYIYSDEVAVA